MVGTGATVVEPRQRPQPQSQLGQLRPLLESPQGSSDDVAFMHTGLGFACADDPVLGAATAEPMILAGTNKHGTKPQSGIINSDAKGALLPVAALNAAGVGEHGRQQPEVPVFDMEMPVLGQHRPDRGAPEPVSAAPLSQVWRHCSCAQ